MTVQKIRLLTIAGVILILVFTWFFIVPKVKETYQAKESLDREKARLEKLKTKLGELQGLNEFELSERTRVSLLAIPAEKNFLDVLAVLGQIANEKGLVVESLQVNPGSLTVSEKGSVIYKLSVVGSVEAVKDYLVAVEKTLPLAGFNDKLNLDLANTTPKTELSVESYFLPLPKTLGAVDASVPKLTAEEEKFLTVISTFSILPPAPSLPVGGKANPFAF